MPSEKILIIFSVIRLGIKLVELSNFFDVKVAKR